jgi:hypothetical protein
VPDEGGQELEGGETAVGDEDQGSIGQPTLGLEGQLPAPVGQFLVAPAVLAAVALRGRQGGQERQRPDPPGPGDRNQQHQAQPAQAAGLDEVALRRAHGVAVDALGADPLAAPALDGVVDAEDHRPLRREGVQQQAQQHAPGRPSAPGGAVQHAMVVGEPPLAAEPGDPEDAGHGASAGRQDRPDQQHLGVPPTPLAEERREA